MRYSISQYTQYARAHGLLAYDRSSKEWHLFDTITNELLSFPNYLDTIRYILRSILHA